MARGTPVTGRLGRRARAHQGDPSTASVSRSLATVGRRPARRTPDVAEGRMLVALRENPVPDERRSLAGDSTAGLLGTTRGDVGGEAAAVTNRETETQRARTGCPAKPAIIRTTRGDVSESRPSGHLSARVPEADAVDQRPLHRDRHTARKNRAPDLVLGLLSLNALRALPYLQEWHRRYENAGLRVIGVHSPQFEFARHPELVADAVHRLGIEFAVALDPDFEIWRLYGNEVWPALYLWDRRASPPLPLRRRPLQRNRDRDPGRPARDRCRPRRCPPSWPYPPDRWSGCAGQSPHSPQLPCGGPVGANRFGR